MGLFYRSSTDLRNAMDRLHSDATALRNQISEASLPGATWQLDRSWVERWFMWYAQWSKFYWHNRPADDGGLWPADDGIWAQVSGYDKSLMQWRSQYENQTGKAAQPHSPPIPPPPAAENGFSLGLDGVGAALGIGAAAAIAVLVLARR